VTDPHADAPHGVEGPDGSDLTFGAAMDELTGLVAELESDSLDVDELTDRVARAADLVQWCRGRIDGARFSVEEVLVRLDADAATDVTPAEPEGSADTAAL